MAVEGNVIDKLVDAFKSFLKSNPYLVEEILFDVQTEKTKKELQDKNYCEINEMKDKKNLDTNEMLKSLCSTINRLENKISNIEKKMDNKFEAIEKDMKEIKRNQYRIKKDIRNLKEQIYLLDLKVNYIDSLQNYARVKRGINISGSLAPTTTFEDSSVLYYDETEVPAFK